MPSHLRVTLTCLAGAAAAATLIASSAPTLHSSSSTVVAPAAEKIVFEDQIWPIIERSCLQCHDSGTAFSNLRLDSPEKILEGGDLGKVLVPGEPDNSPLVTRTALPMDDLDFMPIEGDPLTEEEIETVRTWISEGADFGDWTGVE